MATQTVQQGWSQQTPATQALMRSGLGSQTRARASGKRSKRSATATPKKRKKRASTSSSRRKASAGMKKGSAAAKAWGRKMKRLRSGK